MAAILLALGLQAAVAQPALWSTGSPSPAPAAPAPWVARERAVSVDLSLLEPRSSAGAVVVPLFDGQSLVLERSRVEVRGAGNHTWYGRVRGQPRSEAVLTVVDGHVTGSVVSVAGPGEVRSYAIASRSRTLQSLRLLDPARFPPDHPAAAPAPRAVPESAPSSGAAVSSSAVSALDTAEFIDVMIVYSNQTAAAAGAAIGSQIQYAVDRANLSYGNSAVTTRLRLVHSAQLNYDEGTNTFTTMINQLAGTTDGVMDEVHALRDTYGADLVSLFVERDDACGVGFLNSSANSGFTVVNRACSGDNLTFAHEIGHNLGARHDPYADASNTPYAYGHGYVYVAGAWRTVMAYNDLCVVNNTSCTRLPYFSNPNIFYNSVAMGTASTHDNARVHNERALTVANFRTSLTTPSVQFDAATTSVAEGGGSVSLSVTRSQTSGEATVQYATSSGTAASGSDFTAASGTLTFADGVATQTITVPITDDVVVETSETVTVALSNPVGMVLGARSSTSVTITDNDVRSFRFGAASYTVTEGTTSIVIPVTRNATGVAASVSYATANGTASAGQDYTARSGTLAFKASQSSLNITISITNDTLVEASETFTVNLSAPTAGFALGDPSTTTVTIVDNDTPPPSSVSFQASTLTVDEAAGAAVIVVTRSGSDISGTASVNYATARGTARAGNDFTAVSGTLSFAANETSKSISVPIVNDTATEGAETFTVSLGSPVGTVLGAIRTITVTIAASD